MFFTVQHVNVQTPDGQSYKSFMKCRLCCHWQTPLEPHRSFILFCSCMLVCDVTHLVTFEPWQPHGARHPRKT